MLMKKTQLMQQGENTGLKSELTELREESAEMKTKLQLIEKENTGLKSELIELRKENTGLKSELIDLRKVVSSSMDPQLKEEGVNTFKVKSIEEDVQQNQEDIIDLRINDVQDMQIGQMLNQINNINTTLKGEIVKLDERLEKQLTNVEQRLTNVEARQAVCGYSIYQDFEPTVPNPLTFERIYDEVDSSSGGELNAYGGFTAGVAGIYFITLETTV